MDFKLKGRTWVGNMYHKFEAICQEVDELVTKDSVKYVENQVQNVGESVKKIYSNVVHDFLPPLLDNEQPEAQVVVKKQNDAIGTYIRSMVGIKGKRRHASERKTSKDQGKNDLINCNSSGVGRQRQFATALPYADSHEEPEADLYMEESGDPSIYKSAQKVVEWNATEEEYPLPRYVSFEDENSSLNWKEEHPLTEDLDSPEDEYSSLPSDIFDDRDQRSKIQDQFSPRNFVEEVAFTASQNDKKICNGNDLSEEAETGLFLAHDYFPGMDSDVGAEQNARNQEHPTSEGASSLKDKGPFDLPLCTEEQHRVTDESHFWHHPANEDNKNSILANLPPAILNHDTGLGDGVEETVCITGVPFEDILADIYLEEYSDMAKSGTSVEGNDAKDEPVNVEYTSFPVYKSSTELSQCSGEEIPVTEELSTLEDGNLSELSLTPDGENHKVTMSGKFPPATSVRDTGFRVLQAEGSECPNASPHKDAETDLSLKTDRDGTYMYPHLSVEENHTAYIISVEHKSSCDLPICLTKLHLEAEKLDSSEHENSTKASVPLSNNDNKFTCLHNVSPAISVHDAWLKTFQKDETICTSLPDVLSTNLSSELVTLNVCSENKDAETEVTSSRSSMLVGPLNQPEGLLTNYARKDEKSCYSYTDSTASDCNFSSISPGPASDDTVVKLVPASSSRAMSAVWNDTSWTNEAVAVIEYSRDKQEKCWQEDGSADPEMETIDLSDKVKLEDSCIFVDNRLLYAASSRPRKFRSYKKLIQDAFASRKRLIKEYEQLAIWYGDIDTETSLQPKQSNLPPSPKTASGYSRSSQTCDMVDPEWELL